MSKFQKVLVVCAFLSVLILMGQSSVRNNSMYQWMQQQIFSAGAQIGSQTVLSEDPAAPGTLLLSTPAGDPGSLGDTANPVNNVNALQMSVQNQVASNQIQSSSAILTGDPITAPAGATSFGGNNYPCPAGITGSPTTCIKLNVNGVDMYLPVWTGSAADPDFPVFPPTVSTFSSLQNVSGNPGTLVVCDANHNCAAGTPNGLCTATIDTGVSTPSLSGSSLKLTNITAAGTVNTSGTAVTYVSGTPFNPLWSSSVVGTGTVNTSGTAMTWVSGTKFDTGWVGYQTTVNGTLFTIASVASTTSATLSASAGVHSGVAYSSSSPGQPIKINGSTSTIQTVNSSTSITLIASAGTHTGVTYASTTGCNVLVYRHLTGGPFDQDVGSTKTALGTITNAYADFYAYIQPGANVTGPEFDPDIFTTSGPWTTKASIACYHSSDKWNFYNQSGNLPTGGAWVASAISCDLNTVTGTWRHIQLWTTHDQVTAHNYTFKLLVVDGVKVIATSLGNTITYNSWNHSSGNQLNVEFQGDNNSSAGTYIEYIDKWTFKVWP